MVRFVLGVLAGAGVKKPIYQPNDDALAWNVFFHVPPAAVVVGVSTLCQGESDKTGEKFDTPTCDV